MPVQDCNVILTAPPQSGLLAGFSASLISLGNFLQIAEPEVPTQLLDLGSVSFEDMQLTIKQSLSQGRGQNFVAITTTTASYQAALRTAIAFKHQDPDCKVVFGGHHVTPQAEIVLRRHRGIVDFVVRGEGETALISLIRSPRNEKRVWNLSYFDGSNIAHNPIAERLKEDELDRISPTWQGAMPIQSVPGKFNHATYVSARGCPLECKFCAVRATSVTAKSIPAVIADLRHLVGDLHYADIAIEDNFFAQKPKRTKALCEEIEVLQRDLPFSWDCQTRVESMAHTDIVQAMARAGCKAAYLGVESLVPEHLVYLGKTRRADQYLEALIERALPLMLDAGIDPFINLQLGIPNETQADRDETLRVLERLGRIARKRGRDITIYPQLHVLYPGTPHFDLAVQCKSLGSAGEEIFEEFTPWEAANEPILHYLGEHFAHGVGGLPIGILDKEALAQGSFEVDEGSVFHTSAHLGEMSDIAGISVFKYGRFLTRTELKPVRKAIRHA